MHCQAEALAQLQALRARLLDGLCPAKVAKSERLKRLARRLTVLERNVGRASSKRGCITWRSFAS